MAWQSHVAQALVSHWARRAGAWLGMDDGSIAGCGRDRGEVGERDPSEMRVADGPGGDDSRLTEVGLEMEMGRLSLSHGGGGRYLALGREGR